MIRYALKLWSSNPVSHFDGAMRLFYQSRQIDAVELYHNPEAPFNWDTLRIIEGLPVAIHHTHSHGWHEFKIGPEQLAIWERTRALANYFSSDVIVVHPGQAKDAAAVAATLQQMDDPRIRLENMAGLDVYGDRTFGRTLAELRELKRLRPICFDFEKAVKAACYQQLDYQAFITDCLRELEPAYFHISGGDKDSAMDQHLNLWEATFDVGWIGRLLTKYSADREVQLVFETPKNKGDLENDVKNIAYFKKFLSA